MTTIAVVSSSLGYILMAVLTSSAFAYHENKQHQESMPTRLAVELMIFSIFWPVCIPFLLMTVIGCGVNKMILGYIRYLRRIGTPKVESPFLTGGKK